MTAESKLLQENEMHIAAFSLIKLCIYVTVVRSVIKIQLVALMKA